MSRKNCNQSEVPYYYFFISILSVSGNVSVKVFEPYANKKYTFELIDEDYVKVGEQ